MSDYKRLSEQAVEILNKLHTERLDYQSEYLPLIDCAQALGELADKLEAGTLVELPEPKIDIDFFGGDWYIVYHKVVTKTEGNFNTREAAEARLKELEEKCERK